MQLRQYQTIMEDSGEAVELNSSRYINSHKQGSNEHVAPEQAKAVDKGVDASSRDLIYADIYYQRGKENYQKGEEGLSSRYYELAIEDFNKAFRLTIKFMTHNRKLLKSCMKKNMGVHLAQLYVSRGESKSHLKQYKDAIRDFDKAIRLDPKLAYAYYCRGLNKFFLNKHKEAILDFGEAIELEPEDDRFYCGREISRYYLGQYKRATKAFGKIALSTSGRSIIYGHDAVVKSRLQH